MAEVRPVGAPSAVAVDAPAGVADQEARPVGVAATDPVPAPAPNVVAPTERTMTTAVALGSCPRKDASLNPRSLPR